jgi:CrcB protein
MMDWLRELAAVAGGGALGATSRHLLSQAVYQWLGRGFPWGTLVVNVVGSLILGAVYVLLIERTTTNHDAWRLLIVVGFLGALTTFSTFSMDTLALLEQGNPLRAGANVLANVGVCIGAAWLGLTACRYLTSN